MEIVYTNGMITINETMIVVLVSFLILVFVLNRLMFRPLLTTIQEREDHLNGLSDSIQTAETKAADLSRQLQEKEAETKSEAQQIKKELEEAGSSQAGEILDQARTEIAQIRAAAQEEVKAQLTTAREEIDREAEELSTEIITLLLGRSISAPEK